MLASDKKGYVQIDFSFALFIFVGIFFILYSQYDSFESSYSDSITVNGLQGKAKDLCHFLISTPGRPFNWDEGNVTQADFLGMKSLSNYTLNGSKFDSFNVSNYFEIIDLVGVEEFLDIKVIGLKTNTLYLEFGVNGGINSFSSTYSCYSNYNSEIVKVVVEVWK